MSLSRSSSSVLSNSGIRLYVAGDDGVEAETTGVAAIFTGEEGAEVSIGVGLPVAEVVGGTNGVSVGLVVGVSEMG